MLYVIRNQFPILNQMVGKHPLVYFDNAATTQKPESVIQSLVDYYRNYNANIHRGAHYLADKGTTAYEASRKKIQQFISAETPEQVIFTKGTTEGINLIASGLAKSYLKAGDEILITGMEHHANIVPWQMACEQSGAVLKVIPVLDNGELDLEAAEKLMSEKTKVFSMVYISNALGTINPAKELIAKAARLGAITVLDCAQAVGHFVINVQELGMDFAVFSGHKMFGPTGIGILYGKKNRLEALPPYQGGGEMIKEVTFEKTTYNELPFRFEAGTPNIADGIGLGFAVDFIQSLDREMVEAHENELLTLATDIVSQTPGLRIIGQAAHKASVVSFVSDKAHPSDIGTLLDQYGIAVRTGHHCCQPLMSRFGVPGTVRVSLSFYNTKEELEIFARHLNKVMSMLA
ncbi:MAG TPA: cysteine desulfurase [Catalimonadaceae bacterium]|nr:cysteine desulfurase [Catalimonadaceae bacterium]